MNSHTKQTQEINPLEEMVITWEQYRFTVLTKAMIRIEYSPEQIFQDRPTKMVVNRRFPAVAYEVKETEESMEIITANLRLTFQKERGGFTPYNLSVELLGNYSSYDSSWHFEKEFSTLKGTARTLDEADGAVHLAEGLMNKNGYAVIDDSPYLLAERKKRLGRACKDNVDFYFLGYGRDYIQTLKDYFHLTGHPPLIPRYALGNWWSRYYPYSEEQYKDLIERFHSESVPFSVAVIDMDWHLTDVPSEYGSGWTGYTWNRDLFPEPECFLRWLHNEGLKVSLNLHPSNGVQPHEEKYEEMSLALHLDPQTKQGINFDITNSQFVDAYFKYLHHPLEEMGVDFWWIDWQQGSISKMEGIDPLWLLNQYHYKDHERNGERALIFSRYAGLGSHRYPIGFSGDTITSWESLQFQPYFTATASNVGYTWWSHDIGGHMRGKKDKELYIRWVQFGVFSPINRLHSTGGKYNGKEPWRFGYEAQKIVTDYLQLRHRLIPYIYSMSVRTHEEGLPLLTPMYYHHPWEEGAYQVKNQYYFGTELIVAPITTPIIGMLQRGHVKVWFPEGEWIDFFTGMVYKGGRHIDVYRPLHQLPVFAKAGAIIPLDTEAQNGVALPEQICLKIFAGASGAFTLTEEVTETTDFSGARTQITLDWADHDTGETTLTIQAPEGNLEDLPKKRQYRIVLVDFDITETPVVRVGTDSAAPSITRHENETLIELAPAPIETEYKIILPRAGKQNNPITKWMEQLIDEIHIEFDLKEEIDAIVSQNTDQSVIIGELLALDLDNHLLKAISEMLLAQPGRQ